MDLKKKLCLLSCGAAKIWDRMPETGAVPARLAYTGAYSVLCREYAETFYNEDWLILSDKHGFLRPDDIVPENYDVSFRRPSAELVSDEVLREQAERLELDAYEEIVMLAGGHYVERIRAALPSAAIATPMRGLRIGERMQFLRTAIADHRKESPKPVVPRVRSKYASLQIYLSGSSQDRIRLSIQEIEQLLGFPLPKSARIHAAWWANTQTHSHASAWMEPGWKVERAELGAFTEFSRQ